MLLGGKAWCQAMTGPGGAAHGRPLLTRARPKLVLWLQGKGRNHNLVDLPPTSGYPENYEQPVEMLGMRLLREVSVVQCASAVCGSSAGTVAEMS